MEVDDGFRKDRPSVRVRPNSNSERLVYRMILPVVLPVVLLHARWCCRSKPQKKFIFFLCYLRTIIFIIASTDGRRRRIVLQIFILLLTSCIFENKHSTKEANEVLFFVKLIIYFSFYSSSWC